MIEGSLAWNCVTQSCETRNYPPKLRIIQRALVVLQCTFQRDLLDLGGRPPLRFFRRACNCLKYSGPRLAISFPPFRPSLTAAGSFFFGKIQSMCFNLLT